MATKENRGTFRSDVTPVLDEDGNVVGREATIQLTANEAEALAHATAYACEQAWANGQPAIGMAASVMNLFFVKLYAELTDTVDDDLAAA